MLYKNTFKLIKFILKQEIIKISIFSSLIVIILAFSAYATKDAFKTEEELILLTETFKNPTYLAMMGPMFSDLLTLEQYFALDTFMFSSIGISAFSIFFITRHTRKNEEENQIELLMAHPVGKISLMTSAFIIICVMNLLIGISLGFSISVFCGFDVLGAYVYALNLAAFSILISAITLICAQLFETTRTVISTTFLTIAVFYIIRAIGDVSFKPLTFISPLGLLLHSQMFLNNYFYPIIIVLFISFILYLVASYLAYKRDLNQAYFNHARGKKNASSFLLTKLGYVFTSLKTYIIIWYATLIFFAVFQSALLKDLQVFLEENEMFKQMILKDGSLNPTNSFIYFFLLLFAIMITLPVIGIFKSLRNYERLGLNEHIHSKSISKMSLIRTYLILSFVVMIELLMIVGVIFYFSSRGIVEIDNYFIKMLYQMIMFIPPIILILSIMIFLHGFFPRKISLVWLYFSYCIFMAFFKDLMNLHDFFDYFNVFSYVPNALSNENINFALIFITIISISLSIAGIVKYKRRDMIFNS